MPVVDSICAPCPLLHNGVCIAPHLHGCPPTEKNIAFARMMSETLAEEDRRIFNTILSIVDLDKCPVPDGDVEPYTMEIPDGCPMALEHVVMGQEDF